MVKRYRNIDQWMAQKIIEYNIRYLTYFSHKKNFKLILKYGILSKHQVEQKGIKSYSFADEEVQQRREDKYAIISDRSKQDIHDLVPLYLTTKTPTLLARKHMQKELFFCIVHPKIIRDSDYAFSTGNAASGKTRFYWNFNDLDKIPWDIVRADDWSNSDKEERRKRNSEFLIYPKVPLKYILTFLVNNDELKIELEEILKKLNIKKEVIVNKKLFFDDKIPVDDLSDLYVL